MQFVNFKITGVIIDLDKMAGYNAEEGTQIILW